MSKIVARDANSTSLLACLVLLNEEDGSARPPVVSGCGSVPFRAEDESGTSRHAWQNVTLLHAFFNWNRDAVSVVFRVQVPEDQKDACRVLLQVRDTDALEDVIDQQVVPCKNQNFHFQEISLPKQKFYEVCAKLLSAGGDAEPAPKCIDVEAESGDRFSAQNRPPPKEPILPLVLTLIFLAVGIAVLVILYLVVRGYLSDRHRAGFLPEPLRPARACKIVGSALSSLTCHLFSWKRRRRRAGHVPVEQTDEMSLQDNMTVTSFMSD
jgi:hypothetical protein